MDEIIEIPKRTIPSKNRIGQIYIIKNRLNDKVYIGETTVGYKQRFAQHCKKVTRTSRHFKLYKALNDLGVKNFYVELLEDNVPIEKLYEREIFYIKKFDSFNNGYNSTKGGDGRTINRPEDIKKILQLYENGKSAADIAVFYNVTSTTINRTLHRYNHTLRTNINKYELIDIELFKKLWTEGVVINDLAKYFKINEKSVRRYVIRFKLNKRGKGFWRNAKHLYKKTDNQSPLFGGSYV